MGPPLLVAPRPPEAMEGPNALRVRWLELAYSLLRDQINPEAPPVEKANITFGWPSRGARSRVKKTLGECWGGLEKTPSRWLITLHPCIFTSPFEVLGVLLHEQLHADVEEKMPGTGHRHPFAAKAKALGLEGRPTSTHPGVELGERLNGLLKVLPPFPEGWGDLSGHRRQGARLRLWLCSCPRPVRVRVASDDFRAVCLECGAPFTPGESPR